MCIRDSTRNALKIDVRHSHSAGIGTQRALGTHIHCAILHDRFAVSDDSDIRRNGCIQLILAVTQDDGLLAGSDSGIQRLAILDNRHLISGEHNSSGDLDFNSLSLITELDVLFIAVHRNGAAVSSLHSYDKGFTLGNIVAGGRCV